MLVMLLMYNTHSGTPPTAHGVSLGGVSCFRRRGFIMLMSAAGGPGRASAVCKYSNRYIAYNHFYISNSILLPFPYCYTTLENFTAFKVELVAAKISDIIIFRYIIIIQLYF